MNKPKKKDFKEVCKACMNGSRISSCPSKDCPLAPIKDGKPFRGGLKALKLFCKSCDPENLKKNRVNRELCQVSPSCPLSPFFNEFLAKSGTSTRAKKIIGEASK